jgi:uncharacterized membrane protein
MASFFVSFLTTAAFFAALDFAWLSLMANRLYRPQLGDLLRAETALGPAVAFYLIYTIVLTIVAVLPAVRNGAPTQALITGALIGLAAYATYNLTNAATLRHWSNIVTVADTTWGMVLTGLTAYFAALIAPKILELFS